MGAQASKPPPEYDLAALVFSTEEQTHLKATFARICGDQNVSAAPTNRTAVRFDSSQLQAYTPTLPQRLSYQLFLYMLSVLPAEEPRPQLVNYSRYIIALSHVLKGTSSERAALVGSLACGGSLAVTTRQLRRLIEDVMEAYRNTVSDQHEYASWKFAEQEPCTVGFTNILLQGLAAPGAGGDGDQTYGEDALEKWTSNCTLLQHIINTVFQHCFSSVVSASGDTSNVNKLSLVPLASGAPWTKFSTLLDLPSLLLLTDSLPPACRSPWRLLFSDGIHGESFSMLLKHTINKGPCMLLLRDSEGYVFGGFTGTHLSPKPQFAGDETSFVFSLKPSMQIYNITGYNNNYLYLNTGQETMPNGLGMGGQFDYWGLWLDADYGQGHSLAQPTCTTYGSPQLSASPNFTVNRLEVWGVGPDPVLLKKQPEVETDQGATSILDKDAGAKALLEMINRPQHSDGLREPDPTSETT